MPADGTTALVIGCSSGGVRALGRLFADLAPGLGLPILVVCHFGPDDIGGLCSTLDRAGPLPVVEAEERTHPEPDRIHLAPSGYHLHVEPDGRLALSVDPKQCYCRPSIDILFESAAWHYRAGLVGLILTGANDDGARGLSELRRRRGIGIVQSPEDADAPEMPRAAIARAGADQVLPLTQIGAAINRLCKSVK